MQDDQIIQIISIKQNFFIPTMEFSRTTNVLGGVRFDRGRASPNESSSDISARLSVGTDVISIRLASARLPLSLHVHVQIM